MSKYMFAKTIQMVEEKILHMKFPLHVGVKSSQPDAPAKTFYKYFLYQRSVSRCLHAKTGIQNDLVESLCLPRRPSMETGEESFYYNLLLWVFTVTMNLSETKKIIFPLKSSSAPVLVTVSLTFSFPSTSNTALPHSHWTLSPYSHEPGRFHLRNKP